MGILTWLRRLFGGTSRTPPNVTGDIDLVADWIWISGLPATFATRGEKAWRATVNAAMNGRTSSGEALLFQFVLPDSDNSKRIADLDNFCEPMFSEIVNRLG